MRRRSVALLAVALLIGSCGDDEGEVRNLGATEETGGGGTSTSTSGSPSPCHVEGGLSTSGDEEVLVTLDEWTVEPSRPEVPAGIVSFVAENGGEEPHELVIVEGDSAESLPRDPETGAMDEAKLPEGALVGEIEPFPSGETCRGNFALEAGPYVLICNIVEKEESGESESHFAEGMHTSFTVTGA